MFTKQDVFKAAMILDIIFDNFSPEELLEGINIELEHGKKYAKTNITDDDLIMTTKIALAHLYEYPNYYNKEYGLKQFEEFLKHKLKEEKI